MKKFNMKVPVPKFLNSVKYTLAGVNILFLITGILFVIVGAVSLAAFSEYEGLITRSFFTMPAFVIATGVIIVITSALGFYGAYSQQFYFIAGYVMLLLVVLVFEVSTIIVAYGLRSNAATTIRSTMLESLQQYDSRREVARLWDDMQMEFECCGVAGRFDWVSNQIPVSCCHMDFGTVGTFTCNTNNAHTTGCASALGDWLGYYATVIAVSAVVVTCMQVVFTAIAGWLAYRSKFEEVELER